MKCQFKFLYLLLGKKICKKCPWYVTLIGPEDKDKKRKNFSNCAIVWVPLLMVEVRGSIDGITSLGAKMWADLKPKAEKETTIK